MVSYTIHSLKAPTHITFCVNGLFYKEINIKQDFPKYVVPDKNNVEKYYIDIETNEKNNLIFDFELELSKSNTEEINKKVQFIKRKISELEDESNQIQNNLEFFSNSSSDNPLFKNISSKIESINEKVEFWRLRLRKVKKV